MTQPTVTVTILACNHAPYIGQCLESALTQAADVSLHILVGDDCSDDGTSEIVAALAAAHPTFITHIRHSPRMGGSDNYKYVRSHADGRYIAQLDGDDYWLPGKLKLQVDYMEAHPEVAAVYTNAYTVREDGSPLGIFNDVDEGLFDLGEMLRRGNFLNSSSMLFRAGLLQGAADITGPLLDYMVHLRHARSGLLAQLPAVLVAYRVNSQGSALTRSNVAIRQLYWEAIMDVPRDRVTDAQFADGIADFLRRVLFRSLRVRRLELLRLWTPRVFRASPHGAFRTAWVVSCSVVRAVWKEAVGGRKRMPDGQKLRVLYCR
jgi:glycosyltransferase involved in cell wall biosynthesis